ncbi:hypothetical protein ABEF92_008234 [Exophiala dermatitidis]|uniref:Uncharacterized protein n=1 Tax=Exophiala dermatitidis (strain ATCC 34100 / CBS 525.76 / NIH/UT8656) TaxID=858893 RepID=H6C7I0_EXODN
MLPKTLLALTLVGVVSAQTSYSGCHNHGTVAYCFGPDGEETAVATHAASETTSASSSVPASVTASATTSADTSAVTGCHNHGSDIYCINSSGEEVSISVFASTTGPPPAQYTGCHFHGSDEYCIDPNGEEVMVVSEEAASSEESEDSEGSTQGLNCHFHAGVEHCVGGGSSENDSSDSASCGLRKRDYDIGLRAGTLFVVLFTSALGVFAPLLVIRLLSQSVNSMVFTAIKQFGTGVIISTAFVHLYTHATLMFTNECLGELEYEGTTSAIVMAGLFLAFLFEYLGHRYVIARSRKLQPEETEDGRAWGATTGANGERTAAVHGKEDDSDLAHQGPETEVGHTEPHGRTLASLGHSHGPAIDPSKPNSKLSVMVMEAGILFHSILIGLTLVVAGDSFYKTLLVVIVFHQFFEGLALGARIALLPRATTRFWPTKALMATAYALITPIGMAIGLGVIHDFNGNDRSTILTIGTLDALSAGVLVWVGVVDMWARDWILEGGDLAGKNVPWTKYCLGLFCMIAGFIGMSVLGKWA